MAHEDGCEKEIYEGATCTCDLIRQYGADELQDAADAAAERAAEEYQDAELDG